MATPKRPIPPVTGTDTGTDAGNEAGNDAGAGTDAGTGTEAGASTDQVKPVDQVDPPAPPAPPLPFRIEPVPDYHDAPPPCSGSWVRQEDGGLLPGDADTAAAAGLAWPTPAL